MRNLLCTTIVLMLGLCVARRPLVADTPQPPEGFHAIFDGQSLTGWHGDNPHQTVKAPPASRVQAIAAQQEDFLAHWRVEDGQLVNDGHGPYATTDQEFGDLELLLEYCTVPKADSGIYLRGTPQVQIWDYTQAGGKWDRGADRGSGGLHNNSADAPGRLPLVLADRPFGQWNQFRIVQLGSRTTVELNGQRVVDNAIMENYWDQDRLTPLRPRGPIHLQTHGGEIRWRNIFVREIPADEANRRCAATIASRDLPRSSMVVICPAGPAPSTTMKCVTAPSCANRAKVACCLQRSSMRTLSCGWSSNCPLAETMGWPFAIPATVEPRTMG